MKKLVCVVFVLALALACASTARGQAQITTATVQGDVLDEKGGSVPGASVEAKNLDTNFTRTETTDTDGHFAFVNLAPGRYTLTINKQGFATVLQQNVNLTVGQVLTIPVTMKISSVAQQIVVSDVPVVEVTKTVSSSTLDELAVADTPVLGRKFEDLLTLTPGVSIVQGPDGDEININGQRGIFNNISLDGGDYNNGFFGEQMGGQRAAIDITLEAVKEFQIVASGANAEFGRTAGGVVNVITKSGTNNMHGSLFEYFRTEGLTAATSDGKPLQDFRRNQFGGSFGGPLIKDKLFFFAAGEGIRENLTRSNLSTPIGTACASSPVFNPNGSQDALIMSSPDCQRQALINFFKNATFPAPIKNTDESLPVIHQQRNASIFGRADYNMNTKNQIFGSYSFDWSKNPNQTFDVPTYGTSANGIEGPSKIQAVNTNWFSTLSNELLNEAHFTYARENRPRNTINPSSVPDTAMGFGTTFRFGEPFFLEPNVDEVFKRTDIRDNVSLIKGKHTWKLGGEWIHSDNAQVFRGFFTGRYIFDSPVGFMHYVTQGPGVQECSNGSFVVGACPAGTTFTGGPLLLYLQHGPATQGETFDQSGASDIKNEDFSLFVQDSWKVWRNLTLNYGLRWDAQRFPNPTVAPSKTSYRNDLTNASFPSTGFIPNQNKEFQPRVGFAWDIFGNGKSALRGSWGMFYARQNMLTQVGAITTNGVQQQSFAAGSAFGAPPAYGTNASVFNSANLPPAGTPPPPGASVTVFSKDYQNPRIYTTNVGYEQQLVSDYAAYADFTLSKGVHLTRFTNPNAGTGFTLPTSGQDTVNYVGVHAPFPDLGDVTDTVSSAKSLYRGLTIGMRKRRSHHFLFDINYTYSSDWDDDSNERDPFTFRYANLFNLAAEYSRSDRNETHKFNAYTVADLPWGFQADVRAQAHSAQPITDNTSGTGTGAPCSFNNSLTRFVIPAGGGTAIDCGRNHLLKDNGFFTLDFGVDRPFKIGEHMTLIPKIEMFNTFNNTNNVNPLSTPALFDFNGFLRVGVGDPRQAQLSVRFEF
ncbi:MAG TPA: TonB-dependent receptor [Candidatus Angelobacter sp.]|nr:TonB-dependent receptor [Candidatus Angelobacter sp.]